MNMNKSTESKTMTKHLIDYNITFGKTSFEMLSDFITNLNKLNKCNLENVSTVCFKDGTVAGK